MTFLFILFSLLYSLKKPTSKLSAGNLILILFALWAASRCIYHGMPSNDYTRQNDFIKRQAAGLLDRLGNDLIISSFSAMVFSWMHIVHKIRGNNMGKLEGGLMGKMTPILIIVNAILGGLEIATTILNILNGGTHCGEICTLSSYYLILEVFVFGLFSAIYGGLLLHEIRHSFTMKKNPHRFTVDVVGVGICATIEVIIIVFFTATGYDGTVDGYMIYRILGRVFEFAAMTFLYLALKGRDAFDALRWRKWFGDQVEKESVDTEAKASAEISDKGFVFKS